MIKTTFAAYKARFKELMMIMKPLIIIQALIVVLTLLNQMFVAERNNLFVMIFGLLIVVVSILQWLIYSPAAFRTIQKRELGGSITVEQGISFQKGDKWNYFVLSVFVILSMVLIMLPFIIIANDLIGSILYDISPALFNLSLILLLLSAAFLIYFHLPKLIFAYNIYFVKNLSPKENFKESVRLGKNYRTTVWKYIIGVIIINILGILLMMIPQFFGQNAEGVVSILWTSMIGILFVTPITYLYLSKGYAKIRATTEPVVSNISAATVQPAVIPKNVQ